MQQFEQTLPSREFIRINRSFMVNTSFITHIDVHEKESHLLLLTSGAKLPVSKAGYVKLKGVPGI